MNLHASDGDLDSLLGYLRPALPPELDRHLEAVHLREDSVEIDARHVPVLGKVRVNIGARVEPGSVRVDVQGLHKKVPVFGWVSVDDSTLERVPRLGPMLRKLERTVLPVPVKAIVLRHGGAVVELESAES